MIKHHVGEEISRRNFLKGAAVSTAAVASLGALAGCSSQEGTKVDLGETGAQAGSVPPSYEAETPESWDKEADMVILGVGIAGAPAAVEASDLGLSVIAIDSLADIKDCSCTLSGGWLCGVNTRLQKEDGIEDDIEVFIKDIRRDGGDFGDPDIIRAWGELSGETVDWLEEIGCDVVQRTFDAATSAGSSSHSVARDYMTNPTGNGYGWMEGLENAILERDIDLMTETTAEKLYRDESGRVVGCQVTAADGSTQNIKANKGLLVSTGGCGGSIETWAKYSPIMRVINENARTILSAAPATVQGKGMEMIQAVNGYLYPTLANYGGGGIIVEEGKPANAILLPYVWPDNLIEVNANGERFNDESNFSVYFGQRPYQDQPGMWHVVMFDEETRLSEEGQIYAQPIIDQVTGNGIEGTVVSANTVEELAQAFGMDPATLKASVDEFNSLVDTGGPDQFGREKFGRKMATPPFWGIAQDICVATSKGGAKITPKAQVLDRNDEVIPGLYAAGEVAFFQIHGTGQEHVVGGCNSSAACFGRIAARTVAEEG